MWSIGCNLADAYPLTAFGTPQDSITDFLGLERFAEGRRCRFVFRETVEEVGDVMDKRVLVANLEARYPPLPHIGLITIRNVHAAPTTDDRLVAMIEIVEAVKIVQVPGDGGVGAIYFECIERLWTACVGSGFEDGERAVLESAEEGACIVDADGFDFARFGVLALLDECFGHRGDALDGAVEPESRVD